MVRPKLKFDWIADQETRNSACQKRMKGLMKKAEELTILSNTSACLTFYNRDDGEYVVWPSQEKAKSLIDRFDALPDTQRNLRADDQESYIKTNIKKIEKKLDRSRKAIMELEMDHLMLQLHHERMLADLSQTETENLIAYVSKKIADSARELGMEHPRTMVKKPIVKDEIPKASYVAPECEPSCFHPMGSRSVYLMDKWFFDDPNVEKHGDGTHMASGFNLSMESYDDDEYMETYEGESSKYGGADEA